MRIAFYIEDGLEQIVLTPETDHEKKMLALLHGGRSIEIKNGSFYHCRGGWVRHSTINYYSTQRDDDNSTIFVMTKPIEPSQTTEATQ